MKLVFMGTPEFAVVTLQALVAAGLLIIRVVPLRQEPVDAVNRLRFGRRADLQQLVVVEVL